MFDDQQQKQPTVQQEGEPSDIFKDIADTTDNQYKEQGDQRLEIGGEQKSNLHVILYIVIGILSLLVIVLALFLVVTKLNKNTNSVTQQTQDGTGTVQNPKDKPIIKNPVLPLQKNGNSNQSQPQQGEIIQQPVNTVQNEIKSDTVNTQNSLQQDTFDTDGDGLTDTEETKLGTRKDLRDTDGDGLTDREEVKVYQTDPLNPDTDGDGYKDGEEVKNTYNPKGPGKLIQIPQQ